MRNGCGHQGENERQWKKVNRNTYNISSIKRVTRKFLEVSRSSRAKQWQRNVQKVCCTQRKEKRDKPRPLTRVNLTTPARFVVPDGLPRSRFLDITQRRCMTSRKRLRGRLSTRLKRQTTKVEAIRINIVIKVERLWNPLDSFVICSC